MMRNDEWQFYTTTSGQRGMFSWENLLAIEDNPDGGAAIRLKDNLILQAQENVDHFAQSMLATPRGE